MADQEEAQAVFEEFMDVPLHPLLVHAPVVFVPLLALLAVGYAAVPPVRPHTRWLLGLLALVTPLSALGAKLSGEAFFTRGRERGDITDGFVPTIENHQQLGTYTLYASIALAVLTLALVYLVGPSSPALSREIVPLVLRVLTVVAAAVSVYYVVRTGDSGAKAVWTGR